MGLERHLVFFVLTAQNRERLFGGTCKTNNYHSGLTQVFLQSSKVGFINITYILFLKREFVSNVFHLKKGIK